MSKVIFMAHAEPFNDSTSMDCMTAILWDSSDRAVVEELQYVSASAMELGINLPSEPGIWVWEGTVAMNQEEWVEWSGEWRRPTQHEVTEIVSGRWPAER